MKFEKETILEGEYLKGRVTDNFVEFRVQFGFEPPTSSVILTKKQFLLFANEVEKTKQEILNKNI